MHTHKLGDTLYFHAVTTDDTGAAVAPTSIVTTVYRNGAAVGALTGVAMTSMATGLYAGSAAITVGNGFADGDRLAVFTTAVMSGVSKVALLCEFEVTTYSIDGVRVAAMATDSLTADALAADAEATIAASVWQRTASAHVDAGTFGKAVNDVLEDTGTSGVIVADGSKSGYALSSTGIDAIYDEVIVELSAMTSADDTARKILALLHMAIANGNQSTATTRVLKNRAGTTVASASDRLLSGGTYSQGELG